MTVRPADLADHDICGVVDQPFPILVARPGALASGLIASDLSDEDMARLDYYESGFGYALVDVCVTAAGHSVPAQVYKPTQPVWSPGAPWSLSDWERDWADISRRAATQVMARFGAITATEAAQMMPFYRARGWAQIIAKTGAPQTLRNPMRVDDVMLSDRPGGHDGFFRLKTFQLSHRRFDGSMSPVFDRECFVAFDAALVLPYDPVADTVMLIEQLRYGPIHRGDPAPWVLEPVAGLVDAGETPAQAALREAREEAHLDIQDLLPMSNGYASPGYSTEFYHTFLGICDLSGRHTEQGGLASENEDIRNHTLSFSDAMGLLDSGEINVVPLAMMLLWLATRRDGLRAAAGVGDKH